MLNLIRRLFTPQKRKESNLAPSKSFEHLMWEAKKANAPFEQSMEDLRFSRIIRETAFNTWMEQKKTGNEFGVIVFPILPAYTLYDPDTAKYKDGVLDALREEYKKCQEKYPVTEFDKRLSKYGPKGY